MVNIVQVGEDKIPVIKQLAGVIFPTTYREILSEEQLSYMLEMMYSDENIRIQMSKGHVYYLAYENDALCGYVSISQENDILFKLEKIYILPEIQGRGVGKELMEAVFTVVRQKCPSEAIIELNVNRNNNAKKFYKRIGFCVVEIGDFPIGNGYFMNDYIMRIEL